MWWKRGKGVVVNRNKKLEKLKIVIIDSYEGEVKVSLGNKYEK